MKVKRIALARPYKMVPFSRWSTDMKSVFSSSSFTAAEWRIVYLAFKKATVAQATKVKTTKWNCVRY